FEIILYSFYISKELEYKMIEDIKRYSCYIRWNCFCNGSGISVNALSRIITKLNCLDRKKLDAEEVLLKLQSKLSKATACLVHLRKQKRFLHNCSAKMVSQDLHSLNELEEKKRWEEDAWHAAKSEAVIEA
ncbi:hypothetical protein M406DRAFT_248583, partial [Cryphonectria parasitica EP155]